MANFIQYGGLANGLTQGFNSMMGLARVKMEQQRMEQQQKQQELRNDLGMFKVLTGIQADKSQPMEQKQESLKQIVDIAGKYNPEMAKRLSAYKFHEMPDAQPIFKRMDDYIKNHTDEEITTAIPMFANELIKAGQDADLAAVTLGGVVKMRQAEKKQKAALQTKMSGLAYGHQLDMAEITARHKNAIAQESAKARVAIFKDGVKKNIHPTRVAIAEANGWTVGEPISGGKSSELERAHALYEERTEQSIPLETFKNKMWNPKDVRATAANIARGDIRLMTKQATFGEVFNEVMSALQNKSPAGAEGGEPIDPNDPLGLGIIGQ